MMERGNIMLVGVGGQGLLLASKVLGALLLDQGYDVKVSEVHGMAQRGGSVVTYVKYGEQVHSPSIERGEADFIVSLEELEAARWLPYLKKEGVLLVNRQQIDPMPVITGAAAYPEGTVNKMAAQGVNVIALDALALAKEAGNARALNVVMLGVLARQLSFPLGEWMKALRASVKTSLYPVNESAFALGYATRA